MRQSRLFVKIGYAASIIVTVVGVTLDIMNARRESPQRPRAANLAPHFVIASKFPSSATIPPPRFAVSALHDGWDDQTRLNKRGAMLGTRLYGPGLEGNAGYRPATSEARQPLRERLLATLDKRAVAFGNGINNKGDVVGSLANYGLPWDRSTHPALWRNRLRPVYLPSPPDLQYAQYRSADVVNDQGDAVGAYRTTTMPDDGGDGLLWWTGYGKTVVALDGEKVGGINRYGVFVGARNGKITIWTNGVGRELAEGEGTDINDQSQIVGALTRTDRTYKQTNHAFFGTSVPLYDLGVLPGTMHSYANAVNEHGAVVGYCSDFKDVGSKNECAFFWRDGEMYDLNRLIPARSEWKLFNATDINDRGQIVGYGVYKGKRRGFLLTPL